MQCFHLYLTTRVNGFREMLPTLAIFPILKLVIADLISVLEIPFVLIRSFPPCCKIGGLFDRGRSSTSSKCSFQQVASCSSSLARMSPDRLTVVRSSPIENFYLVELFEIPFQIPQQLWPTGCHFPSCRSFRLPPLDHSFLRPSHCLVNDCFQ